MIKKPNQIPFSKEQISDSDKTDSLSYPKRSKNFALKENDQVKGKPLVDLLGQEYCSKRSVRKDSQDIVFSTVREIYQEAVKPKEEILAPSAQQGIEYIEEKRREIYKILDNMDVLLKGKSIQEAMSIFSHLLTLQSQICIQKIEGFTLVRIHLSNFFPSTVAFENKLEKSQFVVLIFSAVEINAVRLRLAEMKGEERLKTYFTLILDQAFDMDRFNEMSGWLLLEMCSYFMLQLEQTEFYNAMQIFAFKDQLKQSKLAFEKAVQELLDVESIIKKYLKERPILEKFPQVLRTLIQYRLDKTTTINQSKIQAKISKLLNDYTRARRTVIFDFNRLPIYQNALHLRHRNIINLQKNLLEYYGRILKQEFQNIQDELTQLLIDIQAGSDTLKVGDPQYEEKMKLKTFLMQKLETYRRKENLVQSQKNMVEIHQQSIDESIERYQKQTGINQHKEEALQKRKKIDKEKSSSMEEEKKSPSKIQQLKKSR